MKLSPLQQKTFWRLWANACNHQGLTRVNGFTQAKIDAERKTVLKRCGFESLTLVDSGEGFSRVKQELEILADVLDGAVELVNPHLEKARRQRWVIEHQIIPRIAKHHTNPLAAAWRITRDKFRHIRAEGGAGKPWDLVSIEPTENPQTGRVTQSELTQLLMTLNRYADSLEQLARAGFKPAPEPEPELAAAGSPL